MHTLANCIGLRIVQCSLRHGDSAFFHVSLKFDFKFRASIMNYSFWPRVSTHPCLVNQIAVCCCCDSFLAYELRKIWNCVNTGERPKFVSICLWSRPAYFDVPRTNWIDCELVVWRSRRISRRQMSITWSSIFVLLEGKAFKFMRVLPVPESSRVLSIVGSLTPPIIPGIEYMTGSKSPSGMLAVVSACLVDS